MNESSTQFNYTGHLLRLKYHGYWSSSSSSNKLLLLLKIIIRKRKKNIRLFEEYDDYSWNEAKWQRRIIKKKNDVWCIIIIIVFDMIIKEIFFFHFIFDIWLHLLIPSPPSSSPPIIIIIITGKYIQTLVLFCFVMIWKIGRYFIHCLCLWCIWWLDECFFKTKSEKKSKILLTKKMTKRRFDPLSIAITIFLINFEKRKKKKILHSSKIH